MAGLVSYWKNLAPRERNLISIALLIGLMFVSVNYIFDPLYASYESKKSQLEAKEQLLKKYEYLAQTTDRARDKLVKIQMIESSISKGLLSESTPDLANAELQGIVKELAKKANIKFTRITPSKTVEEDGYLLISLKLPFNGSIKQVSQFLYELETAEEFFDITSLSIRTRRREKTQLRVELEITAFIKAPTDESETENVDSDSA